jgi:hypothetical protein
MYDSPVTCRPLSLFTEYMLQKETDVLNRGRFFLDQGALEHSTAWGVN